MVSLSAIVGELDTVALDAWSGIAELLPVMRRRLGVDVMGAYSVCEHSHGWQLDRIELHGVRSLREPMQRLFEHTGEPGVFYGLPSPAAWERNRLVESTSLVDRQRGAWQASAMYRDVLAPVGLGDHLHHRILLCEGPSMLAWFGVLHPRELDLAQRRALRALAKPFHRRLCTERMFAGAPRRMALLEAALGQIGGAAFVLAAQGTVVATNAAGRVLLAAQDREIRGALCDVVAGRPSSPTFDLTSLREPGVAAHWLAVARSSPEQQVGIAVSRARTRWGLTARQSQVLALVVRGHSNARAAAELAMTIRATELHVTALLDRAGVDNRAALVAAVLLS